MTASAVRRVAPRLAHHWPAVTARVARSRRVALFFDFDGTLVPFARRPELVEVPRLTRRVLSRLARQRHVRVFVISGRRRANLQRHLGVAGIRYLGLYGWEAHSTPPALPTSVRDALGEARIWLAERSRHHPGLWVEDKQMSLSVHLRDIPTRLRPLIRRELGRLSRRLRPAIRLFHNRLDSEFVPRFVGGKGATLTRLLTRPDLTGAFPMYFGNDLSDEPAFAAIRDGLAVIVGSSGPTHAHYAIPQQRTLVDTLVRLEALLA
ncbi:MAG TPA: trehalose-phosphatase [Vicinamibacterales bacterium]